MKLLVGCDVFCPKEVPPMPVTRVGFNRFDLARHHPIIVPNGRESAKTTYKKFSKVLRENINELKFKKVIIKC